MGGAGEGRCALCARVTPGLEPYAGVDLCQSCLSTEPTEGLAAAGIPSEWVVRFHRFAAGLGLPNPPGLTLRCQPYLWYHRLLALFVGRFTVGDPTFDDRVFVKTSGPEEARAVLTEGVQTALLALLGSVKVNDIGGNHVTLNGPTLTVAVRPLGGTSPERVLELKLATASLALQLGRRHEA